MIADYKYKSSRMTPTISIAIRMIASILSHGESKKDQSPESKMR